ncbi:O-acetylhomoserine aminocarboxypropyltransferase/cysteine synthase [PVC group bacterium]|nr:O-acetylhomoserine aminocarboxypropyltransferase/cysteine synthase [PVC group bacterium]
MPSNGYKFETLALHAGQEPDSTTTSRGVPIHRTSSYVFHNTEHAANLFGLKELGYIYTRLGNPTQDVLEKRVAALEGGAAALALASGTSGVFYSIVNICSAGEEFISTNNLYGGTYTMFANILPQFNIKAKFIDNTPEAAKKAITDKTRAIFIETIGNPVLDIADVEGFAKVAHENNIPLIVDATFTTPYLLKCIEYGADVVINSLTKWMGGHGTGIGGVVVDAGKFNWKDPKFKLFNEPEESYFGIRFAHDLGDLNPIAFILRMRTVPLRNLGACISPDNAWMFLQGLETLPVRMQRHCDNSLAVAKWLKKCPSVEWIRYPGLDDDPAHENAKKYLKNGAGAVIVFGIKGGREAGEKLINSVKLFSHLANVGDAKSLILHPASTSHSQLTEEQQRSSGLTPELVRLSVGIEHIDDIIADLEQAINAAVKNTVGAV